ncbi:MAG: hypothetical protein FWC95_03255 [Defluviitaleaceae bacterium]|nr:hypothetical protein [Defluviitaleaceae bacterium]
MNDFFALIIQILVITVVQMFAEMFIDADKRPHLAKAMNIACYAAGLFFVVEFLFDNLLGEVMVIVNRAF